MTQEQKDLLMKDLSARVPYGVKAYVKNWPKLDQKYYEGVYTVESVHPSLNDIYASTENSSVEIILGCDDYEIKPYLFPLSSMTEDQEKEYNNLNSYELGCFPHTEEALDYLIKNHFDYRYLIDKGLAIDCTNLNIY